MLWSMLCSWQWNQCPQRTISLMTERSPCCHFTGSSPPAAMLTVWVWMNDWEDDCWLLWTVNIGSQSWRHCMLISPCTVFTSVICVVIISYNITLIDGTIHKILLCVLKIPSTVLSGRGYTYYTSSKKWRWNIVVTILLINVLLKATPLYADQMMLFWWQIFRVSAEV